VSPFFGRVYLFHCSEIPAALGGMGTSSVKIYAKVMASLREGQAELHQEATDVADCGRDSLLDRYASLDEAYAQYIAGRSVGLHGGIALNVAAMMERVQQLDSDRDHLQGQVKRAQVAAKAKRTAAQAAKETKRSAKKATKAAV
jgi:hypothetical protein